MTLDQQDQQDPLDPLGQLGQLTAEQRRVAARVMAEESAARRHVVVYLSGSHAYGFPSPDSDLDIKAMHLDPTERLLGLTPRTTTANRLEVIDGVEIDYTSNEAAPVLSGILGGNGNFIERVLGPCRLSGAPELDALVPLVRASLSTRIYKHYRGFGGSQLRALQGTQAPTAKKTLYVLRTALTGSHLLRTGELIIDVTRLLDDYGFGEAHELIATKSSGERTELAPGDAERWIDTARRVLDVLDGARDASPLPDEPPNRDDLEAWLIETRRAAL